MIQVLQFGNSSVLYSFQIEESCRAKNEKRQSAASTEVPGFPKLSVPDLTPTDRVSKIQNGRHNKQDTIDEGEFIFNSFSKRMRGFPVDQLQ